MAVVFAMLTSYLLSRTLVPTMVHYLLAGEAELYGGGHERPRRRRGRPDLARRTPRSTGGSRRSARVYGALPRLVARAPGPVALRRSPPSWLVSCALLPLLGHDFFPAVDAGQISSTCARPPGTRIEETEKLLRPRSRTRSAR